jgi:hypothetical protein
MNRLTIKQLATRWSCSTRTVSRDIHKFGLVPSEIGKRNQPLFDLPSVLAMEERRKQARMEQLGFSPPATRIITVKEAKRKARAGR